MRKLYKLVIKILERTVVKLHYKKQIDLYTLCQTYEPELWARSNRKAKIPASIRWKVWRRDNFLCAYCGVWAHNLTLDHKIPEKFGGTSEEDNLLTACSSCNQRKGSVTYDKFINSRWLKKKRRLVPQPTLITTEATRLKHEDGTLTMLSPSGVVLSSSKED